MARRLALLTLLVAAADASAGQVAVAAKEVVKTGKKVVDTYVPGGSAGLKTKAASVLGTAPADATKALKGAAGQKSFTPEQLTQVQAQAGQAFSAVTSDPRAAAIAAKAGVTAEKLNALQAQTAAVAAGFKGPDGKPSVEAMGQQAKDFMKSEPVAGAKASAEQFYTDLSANPKVKQAAGDFKKEAKSFVKETTGLTPRDAEVAKERVEGAVYRGRGVESASASFETAAQKALIKFCKKYEGKAAAPTRCRQSVKNLVVE